MIKKLEEIFDLLNPFLIEERILRPIDAAWEQFEYEAKESLTHELFNEIISQFIRRIYPEWMDLNDSDALAEAIWILENTYREKGADGYNCAFKDTSDPEYGIGFVLGYMAETAKAVEREKYISSIITRNLDPLDWEQHVKIAEFIIQNYGELFPENIRDLHPAELAKEYRGLILTCSLARSEIFSMIN